jgi:hypothetical protein
VVKGLQQLVRWRECPLATREGEKLNGRNDGQVLPKRIIKGCLPVPWHSAIGSNSQCTRLTRPAHTQITPVTTLTHHEWTHLKCSAHWPLTQSRRHLHTQRKLAPFLIPESNSCTRQASSLQNLLLPIIVLAFVIRNPSSQSGTRIGSYPPTRQLYLATNISPWLSLLIIAACNS